MLRTIHNGVNAPEANAPMNEPPNIVGRRHDAAQARLSLPSLSAENASGTGNRSACVRSSRAIGEVGGIGGARSRPR